MDYLDKMQQHADTANNKLELMAARFEKLTGIKPLAITKADMDVDAEISFKVGKAEYGIQIAYARLHLNEYIYRRGEFEGLKDITSARTIEGIAEAVNRLTAKRGTV